MDKKNYLQAMDIVIWRERVTPPTAATLNLSLESLKKEVAACTACPLHTTRTQTVFGVGNPKAKLMLIGEAPGFHEDKEGEPFVGRAGQLLNALLTSIGLSRETVFIANILKCRPPNNRDPLPEETEACSHFLEKQIKLIQPHFILGLGRIAAHYLLKTHLTMGQLRGKSYAVGENKIPLRVTYHPAYLLRSPQEKAKAWEDWVAIKRLLSS